MGRRNTSRNRYSKRNVNRAPKLTKAQIKQIQEREYKRLSSTIENNHLNHFINILVSGYGIKADIIEMYDGMQGSEYDYVLIPQTDTEVRVDKVLLCYSIAKRAYMTIGLDYKLNAASILFYSRNLEEVIGSLSIDDINAEYDAGSIERINPLFEVLENFDNFHDLQHPEYIIRTKSDIFPELCIEEENLEGDQISSILD